MKYAETASASVEVVEVDVPEPGKGEILVRLSLRPVNPADVFSLQGFYPGFKPATLPAVPGLEGVGKVARCGAATSGKWREGQRVVGVPWGTLGGHGTWAQYTVAPEAALFAVPDAVPDDAAAQFLVNPLTALAFFDVLDVPRGGWLLSNAANSVLGRMLIRLAARRGVRTVNLVRRREYVAALEALGADAVVVTTEGDDVAQRVREITGGEGAYAGVDPVGGEATGVVAAGTRAHGTVLLYSAMADIKAVVGIPDILFRDVRLHGFWLNFWLESLGERREAVLSEVMGLIEEGVLAPDSGRRFPLAEVREAVEESQRSGHGGKVLLEG